MSEWVEVGVFPAYTPEAANRVKDLQEMALDYALDPEKNVKMEKDEDGKVRILVSPELYQPMWG